MNRPKPSYFRSALDLRDKVQVKVLRKRLKLSDEQFNGILRKSGNSISAIAKEATHAMYTTKDRPKAVSSQSSELEILP